MMKKTLITTLVLFCGLIVTNSAHAAISFDASSSVSKTVITTYSWNHTVGGGCTNPIIFIEVLERATTLRAATATYNGVAATQIWDISNSAVNARSIGFYVVNPATGQGTSTVTYTSGSVSNSAGVGMSFCGVNQATPIDASSTAADTSLQPSSTVTVTNANEWLVDGVASVVTGQTLTATSTQTSTFAASIGTGYGGTSYAGPKSSNYKMAWDLSGSTGRAWAIGAASFIPVVAAGNPAQTSTILSVRGAFTCRGKFTAL